MKLCVVLLGVVFALLPFYGLATKNATTTQVFGINSKNVSITCGVVSPHPPVWSKGSAPGPIYYDDGINPAKSKSTRYSSNGSTLVISNLNRVKDEGHYECMVPQTLDTEMFNMVIYEPPTGIKLQPLGGEDTVTLLCNTIGGSKPPVSISLDWKDRYGINRELPSVTKTESPVDKDPEFCSTELKVALALQPENALDRISCTAVNKKTDTSFSEEIQLFAPDLVHGTPKKFFAEKEIPSIIYTSQVGEDDKTAGLVRMKLKPEKPIYLINETVSIEIEQPNGDLFPLLQYKWYSQSEEAGYTELRDNGGKVAYKGTENATVHCSISNLIGTVMISVDINVKKGSSYSDLNQSVSAAGTSSTLLIGIIIGVLVLLIVIILVVMFAKRRMGQNKLDRKYDVRKNTQEHQRELEMENTGNTNQVTNNGQDRAPNVTSYTAPNTAIEIETESLMKSAINDDDKVASSGNNAFRYEPQSSYEIMTSRDGYSTGDDLSHGGYNGVGDDISMKSGSTICIDDETFPLPQLQDRDEVYYVNDPRKSYADSQHLSSTD